MSSIFEGLLEKKTKSILNLFIKHRGEIYHLQKISKQSKVPISSTFRLIKKLVDSGLIAQIMIGRFKVYRLADNQKTKVLIEFWEK